MTHDDGAREASALGGGVGGRGGGGGVVWTGTSVGLWMGTMRLHDGRASGLIGIRLSVAVIGAEVSPPYRLLPTLGCVRITVVVVEVLDADPVDPVCVFFFLLKLQFKRFTRCRLVENECHLLLTKVDSQSGND